MYQEQLDAGMSDSDAYNLLVTTGMLVKAPLVVTGNTILLGFKEPAWEEAPVKTSFFSMHRIYR